MSRSNWIDCTLGDVIELKRGYDLPQQHRRDGNVPIISSSGPSGLHNEPKVKAPGVVTGRYGTIGKVFFVTQDFWPLNTTLYVRDFKGNDPKFINYFLRTIDFIAYSDKAAVPGVNRNHLHEAKVRLPPLSIQRKIAKILGALDDKIDLNSRINETLESMAKAIFKEWFIDFGPVKTKAEGKKPFGMDDETAALFPDSFEGSEIGMIPIGWKTNKLNEILDVLETGNRPKGGVSGYSAGIPNIGAESIVRVGYFDFSKTKFVPVEFHNALMRGKVQNRDVLIYKDGGKPGMFEPKVSMFGDGFPFPEFSINEHVYRVRLKPAFGQVFLYLTLVSDRVMEDMRRKGTGVAVPGLNSTAVKSLEFIIPTGDIINAFNKTVDPLFDLIISNAKEIRELETMRDLLLPKLISGDLRLSEVIH